MLTYLPDTNNSHNFLAKLHAFTEDGRRKLRANATRLKAVSGVCLTFGVRNLNLQQEKELAEFFSGSNVFINLPMQTAPLVVIELSKQHNHFPNESIVVWKIFLKKSLKPCSSRYSCTATIARSLNTLALNIP